MTVAAAVGYPSLKAAGLIPELFADEFNVEYWATTLLPRITTGKFLDKLASAGDKITIPNVPTFVTHPYTKGQTLDVDTPTVAPTELTMDRARYSNTLVDDIDMAQSHMDISSKYVDAAVNQMSEDIETEFFADIYTRAHAANKGATAGAKSASYDMGAAGAPVAVTSANATNVLTRIRAVLGEQNAARGKKLWVCIPEWMRYLLVNSELKGAHLMGDDKSVMRTGRLGEIDGLTIYVSPLLKTTAADEATGTYIQAGNLDAIAYLAQMNKTDKLSSETTFGMKFRQLMCYDWGVKKSEGLVTLYAYNGGIAA